MLDVTHIIQSGGLLLLFVIVFAEVGLFLGFFLPGDTLLITAGIYAHEGHLSILAVIAVCLVAAIAGDNLSYFIGKQLGPKVFSKPDGIIFRKDHIDTSEKFFARFGAKTLLVSHFLPVVRSFTPMLAGVARMPHRRFFVFNAVGDAVWSIVVPLLGYYVGSRIPNIDQYILLVLLFAIVATITPTIFHIVRIKLRQRRRKQAAAAKSDKTSS
ncbi:MAG: dedA protein [Candidatus Saccharibacteria bacterium]|nr:dedA protein [Candidatus Saccharibacteria bacterium]